MDPVEDYAAFMKEIFDFPAMKAFLAGGVDGSKRFNVLANAMHGGRHCSMLYL